MNIKKAGNKQLKGEILKIKDISEYQKDRMFDLLTLHFDGVERKTFEEDLEEKSEVIILRDPADKIQGFSTLMLLEQIVDNEPIKAVFSGDTIIHKEYWGETELLKVWGRYTISLIEKNEDVKLYWFLISMGYKTYRFLPIFFYEFYPRYDKPIPEYEKKVLDAFASQKFPIEYDSKTGVIHFDNPKAHLRPGVAEIDDKRLKNSHIKYFAERNPLWEQGDELACIARLSKKNYRPAAYRMINNYKQG